MEFLETGLTVKQGHDDDGLHGTESIREIANPTVNLSHYLYAYEKKKTTCVKVKVACIYLAPSCDTFKALRHGSHSLTCKLHHACLYHVSIHQMALPVTCDNVRLIAAYYSSVDPERMIG